MVQSILQGYLSLFEPTTFVFLLIGFMIGLIFGIIPGLTATLAIALLLPITFVLEPTKSLVMAMGIFMSGIYSGGITGTLINIPGTPGGAITAIEGYPLMMKGKGALALTHGAFASVIGGCTGVIILMTLCPIIAKFALLLHTPDRFSLMIMALVAVIVSSKGGIVKGVIATTIGLMLATIGIDVIETDSRFTFGNPFLTEGINLLPAMIGMFAISELLSQIDSSWKDIKIKIEEFKYKRRDFIPKLSDIKRLGPVLYIKSILIGAVTGAMPGAGASVAGFMAYAEAKRGSKHPEEWGNGALEGVVAPEAANNAMCGGAMIPLLTLGIPGDAVTAVIIGIFRIQGIVPGEALFEKSMPLIATIYAALMISAILIPISLWLFAPYYIRIALVKKSILYSFIAIIAMLGPYAATFSEFQILLAFILGVATYILKKFDFPVIPLLMGLILGPMTEEFLRRSLILHSTPTVFLTRPISLAFIIISAIFIYYLGIKNRVTHD